MNCDPKELQKLERRHIKTSFFAVLLQTLLLSGVCALCGFVLDLPEVMKWGPLVCLLGVVALELRERAGDRLWLEPARTLLRALCQSDALNHILLDWRQGLPYLRAEWQQFQVVVHFENAPLAHRLRLNVTLGFETRVPLKLFARDAADLPQKALEKLTRRGEWQAIPCDDALLAYSPDPEAAQRFLKEEPALRLLREACCGEQGALEFCGDAVIWDRLLPPSHHALDSENLFKIWGLLREMAEIAASVWGEGDQSPDEASGEATLDQVETKQAPPPGASST